MWDKFYFWNFVQFFQGTPSIQISHVMLADNTIGIYPIVVEPSAVEHLREDKYVKIQHSTFIGRSTSYDCNDKIDTEAKQYKFR